LAVSGEGFEDLVGGLGPYDWFGILVPVLGPGDDVAFEFCDRAVGRALQFTAGQFSEPAFDEVEPGGRGGGEVQHDAGVLE